MRIIGIDPGTNVAGWGVIDCDGGSSKAVAWGVVKAKRSDPVPDRLLTVCRGIEAVIEEHRPEIAAIEEAFYGKSIQSALRIGEARGAAIVVCRSAGVEVRQFAPAEVKKSVTGNGNAHKSQVATMVTSLLSLDETPEPEDATDALAVALALCHRL